MVVTAEASTVPSCQAVVRRGHRRGTNRRTRKVPLDDRAHGNRLGEEIYQLETGRRRRRHVRRKALDGIELEATFRIDLLDGIVVQQVEQGILL